MLNLNRIAVLVMILGFVFLGQDASFATSSYDNTNAFSVQQANTNRIQVSDSNFTINYNITNGTISEIHGNNQSRSVIIHTKTTGNGILTIALPRELADSKTNGNDDKFFVTVDGQEEPFDETKTTQNERTLSIPCTAGTQYIEIIGTKAVPEFEDISYMVFSIAIVSTIILVRTRIVFQSR
jgi:hypothetical protein